MAEKEKYPGSCEGGVACFEEERERERGNDQMWKTRRLSHLGPRRQTPSFLARSLAGWLAGLHFLVPELKMVLCPAFPDLLG